MKHIHSYDKGEVNGWMIATIGLIVVVVGAGLLAAWSFLNYQEQKTNVDSKVGEAQALAKKEQAEEDEKKFAEREKEPRRDFVGPDDYGRLTFSYAKTWSVYVAKAEGSGDYRALLHPVVVPPDQAKQQYALRVTIADKQYSEVVASYDRLVKEGKLRSSTVSVNGENGVRLDGNFSDDIRGAAVIFKIRDKTVTLQTDADTFKPDFDTLIQTVKFTR